ncbi:hypothetical protein CLV72_10910 [Allonocardiopsis opalescens]|uniref:Uncharacterized protein n=1 Tax=Allonocardiopsis opalescens TaxID=1144618 RepID=A0A2T0PV46_9ACTN|nr:hypothetical protein CLV72_10910 [Allonocardiopsis opalescens]
MLRPVAASVWRFVLPFLPLLGLLFVVMLLLGSIVFETAAEGIGVLGGAAVGLVAVAVAAWSLVHKARRAVTGTTVVVSPTGVELRDTQGFQLRMRWPDVTEVGTVHDQLTKPGAARAAGRRSGAMVHVPELRSQGLKGWGERVVPPRAPQWLRQRLAAQPRDPRTGLWLVAISFASAGPEDHTNQLLAHTRHHRPDLFTWHQG